MLLVGCSKDELFVNPIESTQKPPTGFIIYNTSFEIHEFNHGYYSGHTTQLPDDGQLVVGITYVDFNKDGYVDILGKDSKNPSILKLYTNDGNDNYNVSILSVENGFGFDNVGPRKILTADVNNDGELDIIVALAPDDDINPRGLMVFENKGNGEKFYRHTILGGKDDWLHGVSAGDINKDGNIDIFMSGMDYVFLGNGDFTFNKKQLPSYIKHSVTSELIDINKDGFLDVLLGKHIGEWDTPKDSERFSKSHLIHFGTGDDNLFGEEYILESNYQGTNITLDFSVVDFDNDGDLDLFVNSNFDYGSRYVIQYYQNLGNKTFINKTNDVFENESNLVENHYDIDWIKFIDINNDGMRELMIEGMNWGRSGNDYINATFNGFQLNENKKFIRKMFK